MTEEMIERLKILAKRNIWPDEEDFEVYRYCGGNVDDAYEGGEEAGETQLARNILSSMGISW
jgi:hypothetical protein